MGRDYGQIAIGVFTFLLLLVYGVVDAISRAKDIILDTLFSTMFSLDFGSKLASMIAITMLLLTAFVVFIAIPGKFGLFRMLIGNR